MYKVIISLSLSLSAVTKYSKLSVLVNVEFDYNALVNLVVPKTMM